jgi:hypothetical protein
MKSIMERIRSAAGIQAAFASALIIAAYLLQAAPSLAEDLPEAEKIIDKYIEATGGRKAYSKIDNIKTVGTFEMPAQGMSMSITTYNARPNLMYTVIESDQVGKIERGVSKNGVTWENSVMTGPSIKEGAERKQMLEDATFNKMANWKDIYTRAETLGTADVNGKAAYKVALTTEGGDSETYYFEKDSGLLVKAERTMHSQMGDIPSSVMIGDYRDAGGVLHSFETVITVMGQKRKITYEKVETNIELPEGIFDLPAEIAALQDKKSE